MLKIRPKQIETLRSRRHEQFQQRLVDHLHSTYQDHLRDWSKESLEVFARTVIGAAPNWGFRSQRDIAEVAMLVLEIKLAWNPARAPDWFSGVVNDKSLNTRAKHYHLIRAWHEHLRTHAPIRSAAAGLRP